ncbi:ROK family protein [Gorillibacterium sp. sgz5001074]|uniref:ROK family protein n=1 Tax=Gorillibacterium sp. sgz5001074 TaxID=3446695 RepID=UPI003F665115
MLYRIEDRISTRKSKDIYELVRQEGTVDKLLLLERSGLTPSTLTRILEELTGKGLLEEVGFGESTGGRRPILYRTNPQYAYAFGLEISRTRSMLVLADLHMNVIGSTVWRMSESYTPDNLLREVIASAAYMLETRGIPKERVLGMGVGAVGPLDPEAGIIHNPLYFPSSGWENVQVTERLSQALGIPVLLDNGANTALTGEYRADPVKRKHLLYLHLGAGLRSAMMTNGALVYGAVDMEGAVGQMVIEAEGVPHREPGGNRGALESYVSIHALEREWSRAGGGNGFAGLLAGLADEQETALAVMKEAGRFFGIGLANLLNVLHPEKVVLGGPVAEAHPVFFETAVPEALRRTYYYPSAYEVEFARGELGESAIAVGAAVMTVNRLTV